MPKNLSPSLSSRFDSLEREIVAGRGERAKATVKKLIRLAKGRSDKLILARLARRVGLPEVGQRLLAPYLRPTSRRGVMEPTVAERAEYAIALRCIGATEEAVALLETLQDSDDADSVFFLAICRITQWRYAEAIPLLQRYLKHPAPNAYQRLVAETNLASALIHEGALGAAEKALREIEIKAQSGEYHYALGKNLYFRAELEILRQNPDRAIKYLNVAKSYLAESTALDRLLNRFWQAVAEHQREKSTSTRAELLAVRAEAEAIGGWETVRNVDFHLAWFDRDAALYRRVYFGTPSEAFRRRMRLLWPKGLDESNQYAWCLMAGERPIELTVPRQAKVLKAGSVSHRLFRALQMDFYRPLRVTELHSRIYPGEFYDAASSPQRVKHAIRQLRRALAAAKLPLTVEENRATYRLHSKKPFVLIVSAEAPVTREDEILRRLHEYFAGNFSAREAASKTGEPLRSLQRVLNTAVAAGHLTRQGASSHVRYQFARPVR